MAVQVDVFGSCVVRDIFSILSQGSIKFIKV